MIQDNENENEAETIDTLKSRVYSKTLWLRIFYMAFFYILSRLVSLLIGICCILQTISRLLTGKLMMPVWDFTANLNAYMIQLIEFLTYRSEDKPFPFMEWPNQNAEMHVKLDAE
ncbi:MAG: DUF4389 domain-containing protein [Endozoicomonadaceae bacterium]|nr:DUF4389 domain-containing protein [Endozoicomonadaceae bacterium]